MPLAFDGFCGDSGGIPGFARGLSRLSRMRGVRKERCRVLAGRTWVRAGSFGVWFVLGEGLLVKRKSAQGGCLGTSRR